MNNNPTLHDVAQAAGVSVATVSNVMNGKKGQVSEKTKAKVEAAVKSLGYQPNTYARQLKSGQSNLVAFIVPDQNPFFTDILNGLTKVCLAHHLQVIVISSEESEQRQNELIDLFVKQRVNAIVLAPVSSHLTLKDEWKTTPIVTVDRTIDEGVSSVTVNNTEAGFQATDYLLKLGHESIAILLANPNISTTTHRQAGYEQALTNHQLAVDTEFMSFSDDKLGTEAQIRSGYQATKQWLTLSEPPSALIATNYLLMIGALQAFKELDVKIGKDISFIGFDNSHWNEIYSPAITVVEQPANQLGECAAQLIIEMNNHEPATSVELSTHLAIRASCAKKNER
ncbi:LacI family DNA-binding transcriptional regulator [Staphylococcus simulans]|uniref:LacI family DNA-binding transcriptional regulator n=1 Tax=Staphylococcus simulans TaxID=1286 RepID=UPI00399A3C35